MEPNSICAKFPRYLSNQQQNIFKTISNTLLTLQPVLFCDYVIDTFTRMLPQDPIFFLLSRSSSRDSRVTTNQLIVQFEIHRSTFLTQFRTIRVPLIPGLLPPLSCHPVSTTSAQIIHSRSLARR